MTSHGNILIVDDTPANLELLSGLLKENGYKVWPAPNGKWALQGAENNPPDLVLLDINMPEMDGFEVCRQLKEKEKLCNIPIIFISALTEKFDKLKAFQCGGVDYITKPFQAEEVLARVKTHIELYRSQIEIQEKNEHLQKTLDKLKATQSQLIQADKMASLGVLTAGIAHEVNNPLNFTLSSTKGLKNVLEDVVHILNQYKNINTENFHKELKRIEKLKQQMDFDDLFTGIAELMSNILTGGNRISEIVKSLQMFSHPNGDEKKHVNIHKNIDLALVLLQNKYRNKITIAKNYGNIPRIVCCPSKLNQVFVNILSNAIDTINSKQNCEIKKISIATSLVKKDGKNWVMIEFIDTGQGIAKETLEHIFEPFFTTKKVGKGTGLGLFISMRIIQAHGGKIEVTSKVEEGTSFHIYLPSEEEY